MAVKFEKIYDEYDGLVDGYKCGEFYIMKYYTWGNNYNWIINKDGRNYYFNFEFDEEVRSGNVILCESLKDAKQKVKEMINK